MPPFELAKPRVVFLTHDGAYSRIFIKSLLAQGNVEVIGVFYSTSFLRRGCNPLVDLYKFIREAGLFYAIYQAYIDWVLPWMLRLARDVGSPILKSNDVNSFATLAWLRALNPDILLSFNFNQKMAQSIMQVPKRGILNFHPSYLPTWRGVDPVLFALQKKNSVMGASIHMVSSDIDEGDLLLREQLNNEFVVGLIKSNKALFKLGGRMAAEVLADFDRFNECRLAQINLVSDSNPARYDGWKNVGQLGFTGLWKALWSKARKVS